MSQQPVNAGLTLTELEPKTAVLDDVEIEKSPIQ